MYFRHLAFIVILIIASVLPVNIYPESRQDSSIQTAKERALLWLKNQKVPNSVIPDPQPERRNLVVSYEIDPKEPAYKYIFGRSIIYDDALAVIAFTMNRDYRNASQILMALKRLQRKDGGLWFGYNVNNDWPSEKDYSGSTERTGATAWVGYSAVYYIQARLVEDPSFLKSNREAKTILAFAQSIGDHLIKMQVQKNGDLRQGLITGGKNSYTLKLEGKNVNEIFIETNIDWISTEHNIDAYFFLRDLGIVTKNEKYSQSASAIRKSMLRAWSEKNQQYYRGIKPAFIDEALALDCASWGAVFSISAGKPEYALQSLETIEKLYASTAAPLKGKGSVRGYKPYTDKEIYEEVSSEIARHYFPALEGLTWDYISGVWVEGSMGAAFAYLKAGNRDKAAEILRNMLPLQSSSGGFIYFTQEIPHEFSTYVSVASTAWFIMIASAIENQAIADSFWSR
ncbi:MAG: hypothetical protein CVV49_16905 [Spirochaetae bacterium HGW-Spirochaetae-5]|nr:MAG: hypothetical protein CVV49_16905 [Spirochaetae bacterium HGW-Spirochaetae-5]